MFALPLNYQLETLENLNHSEQLYNKSFGQPVKVSSFLQAIIEGFVDGVLIVNEQGQWVHVNETARRICRQISNSTSQSHLVPHPIWQVCESLIESRTLFADKKIIIESEIDIENIARFRIRVRWLDLDVSDQSYLLITLEDRCQSSQNLALSDAQKYGLTSREAEVWLLRRAKLSYKEIASKLYITTNTVKKHLKNIYAKQQEMGWEDC
ncbi:MAG TPA: helix-turn-helix transcriptional regulator [Cyanobacteria bacterium UBA11370]|nr:helix-turn-helix transcriptional regulator [Cyanobacteria bacterium UBA11370]HBY76604.1 helix-turn-helix transcriptional regulator [Cyanobacteria bacterium UBA11148]